MNCLVITSNTRSPLVRRI